jgi:uncharacterized protein with PIN domain
MAAAPPPEAVRFICDEMLGRLARYLRAAGYDTALAHGGTADRDLVALARREQRVFVTCDRRIAEHRDAAGVALILDRGTLDEHARAVHARCAVDWLHRPFTRCLVDNTPLVAAGDLGRDRLPADVAADEARRCPACARVYWVGSHHRRMRHRLAAWRAGQFAAPAAAPRRARDPPSEA